MFFVKYELFYPKKALFVFFINENLKFIGKLIQKLIDYFIKIFQK